jgi:hypothetical protein
MEQEKEERERESARLRRRLRYHKNEVRTMDEKGEEVPKVPIEAPELQRLQWASLPHHRRTARQYPAVIAVPAWWEGREEIRRFRASRFAGVSQDPVSASAFKHKRLSPCVDQNEEGHLAVVSSADEAQFTTVRRRACAMASASFRTAVADGGSELLRGHVNVSEDDGRKRTTTATTPTASARIFVKMAAESSINGEWKIVKKRKRKTRRNMTQSEGVGGSSAVRRDIPTRANAR